MSGVPGGCTHCGLALGRHPIAATVAGEPGRFCCVGCLLAMQITRARGDAGTAASLQVRLGLAIFFAINVMMTSMSSYVPHVYGGTTASAHRNARGMLPAPAPRAARRRRAAAAR